MARSSSQRIRGLLNESIKYLNVKDILNLVDRLPFSEEIVFEFILQWFKYHFLRLSGCKMEEEEEDSWMNGTESRGRSSRRSVKKAIREIYVPDVTNHDLVLKKMKDFDSMVCF